jgi:Arc/MetJ family transcription regulator
MSSGSPELSAGEAAVAKAVVDLDESALRAAMLEYGTSTTEETVNRALREAVATRRAANLDGD